MADNEIVIEIKGKLDTIEKQLDKLEGTVSKKGTAIGAGLVAGITAAVVQQGLKFLGAATRTIVRGFEKAVDEASNAQKAVTLFNASLSTAGNFSKKASEDFQEFASSLQSTIGISDDVILKNAAILASLGGLSGQGLERATQAAVDFAATGRVSLESAFDAVAKAAAGNVDSLSRYGVRVDENIPKSEKFAAALDQLGTKFGGLALANANTFDGALLRVTASYNDIFENAGKIITQSPVLVAVIGELSKVFSQVAKGITGLQKGDFLGNTINEALKFGEAIVTFIVMPIEAAIQTIGFLVSAVKTGFTAIGFSIVSIIEPFAQINSKFGAMATALRETLGESLVDSANATGDQFKEIFDFKYSAAVEKLLTRFQEVAAQAPALMESMRNGIAPPLDDIAQKVKDTGDKLTAALKSGLANTISQGIQTFIKSLAKGENAFGAFVKVVLNTLGDMAISMGGILIAAGLSIDALKGLQGGAAVAAGIALVALGSIAKVIAGAGGEGNQSVGGVGGAPLPVQDVGGGGGFGPPTDEFAPQAGTSVSINIQGDVLDRRESGLAIAEIIQEHFNNNGNIGVVGVS